MLRCANLLETVSDGVIWLDGVDITDPRCDAMRCDATRWVDTGDPLLDAPVPLAEGAIINTVEQVSASDPTSPPPPRSRTLSWRARNKDGVGASGFPIALLVSSTFLVAAALIALRATNTRGEPISGVEPELTPEIESFPEVEMA